MYLREGRGFCAFLSGYRQSIIRDTTRDTTRSIVVIQVNNFQNELMVEIYSKNLVRAIGKVLLMKFS